ncbi:MAG: NnrU family protein [Sphingomonadaceae bacterium]
MNPVAGLAVAVLLFVGSHLAMSHAWRAAMIARLGERGFQAIYSLVSLVFFGWIIWQARHVPEAPPLWVAPAWFWGVAAAIMLFASILLVGAFVRNPAFPHPRGDAGGAAVRPAAGVFAITRHPMNMAVAIWAVVHILLWGGAANLPIAGGFLFLAVAGSFGQDRKKTRLLGDAWRGWRARTSFWPFAALVDGRIPWRAAAPGWTAFGGGLVLWLAITYFHAPSVSPLVALGIG